MKNTEIEYLKGHPYRMPQALNDAPYKYLYISIWMDGLISPPVFDNGFCIENGPDGKGSIVFCLEHADVALLDSDICHATVFREEMSEPVWTTNLDRENCEKVLSSGPDMGHIVFRTPVMEWEPGEYFVLLTNLDKQYSSTVEVLGSSITRFTIKSYSPSYRASTRWMHTRTVKIDAEDGQYVVPADDGEEHAALTNISINDKGGSQLRLFSNGKQSLYIDARFGDKDKYKDILIGLYRVGESSPLWTTREMVNDFRTIELYTWDIDLTPDKYFILVVPADIPESLQGFTPVRPLGHCLRYDFSILPDGRTLEHPQVDEVTVTPLSIDIWEQYRDENFVSAPCAVVDMSVNEPVDGDNHIIGIRCFDTADEQVAVCREVKTCGRSTLECFQPLVDGHYRMVVYHNGASFKEGDFIIKDGVAATVKLQDLDAGLTFE